MVDQNVIMQMLQNQQRQLNQQQKLFEVLARKFSAHKSEVPNVRSGTQLKVALANGIQEFSYDPDSGNTFLAWYKRYEDIFIVDGSALDESAKVRLLMQKLGCSEHTRYCNYILPKHPRDYTLQETVEITIIFGERTSIFN
ncbi:unnamed protein product, partial [Dicrocoelium dendriticum]